MGFASLLLGCLSIVLGIVPLLPVGGPVSLLLAALGLPLGVLGICLALFSRSDAFHGDPHVDPEVGAYTAGLCAAVIGTLLCLAWIGGLFYAQRKIYHAAEQCRKDPQSCGRTAPVPP